MCNLLILLIVLFTIVLLFILNIYIFQNLPFASECELKPAPIVSQSVAMMSNPYVNQLFNAQMYQQQQPMMSLETHHKQPVPQIMY